MPLTYDVITYTRPDSVVVNLSDPPYMLNGHDGFGITDFQHTTIAPPGSHGEYWYDTRMEAKVVSVDFSYFGDGVTERQDARRAIVRLFNPLLGPGVLRLDQVNGVSRELKCILAESLPLPTDDFMGAGAYRTVVRLKSHGIPAFRDPTIQSVPVIQGVTTGNFLFPWTFPRIFAQSGYFNNLAIVNNGDIDVPVRISMNGPLSNPTFRNNTTGKVVSLTGITLGAADSLTVDTDPTNYVVQVNGVDAFQYLVDAEFWDLVPGTNNVVFDIGSTTGVTAGTIQWYDHYLGQ